MDNFNVPKKVNRHVLKALNILSDGNFQEGITTACIYNQVKYQMRNLVPVPDLEHCIQKSLKNLSEIGLVEKKGPTRYCIGRNYAPSYPATSYPTQSNKRIFRASNNRNRSRSELDPNLKRTHSEEDSLSGDEFDKTRKRFRSNNKQLRYSGRNTILPRARQHCNATTFGINSPFIRITDCQSGFLEEEILTGDSPTKNSELEFTLANVTPVSSLQVLEIGEAKENENYANDIKNENDTKASPTEVAAENNSSTEKVENSTQLDCITIKEINRKDHIEGESKTIDERS